MKNKTELRQEYKGCGITFWYWYWGKSLAVIKYWHFLFGRTHFHIFYNYRTKLNTNLFCTYYPKDKEIIVSKADFETRKMTHFLLTDNTKIKKNEYNIPEPVDGIEFPHIKLMWFFVPFGFRQKDIV
jgi:5-formyltetrahydrofolate cyclo-ligase